MNTGRRVIAVDIGNTSVRARCFQVVTGRRPSPIPWPVNLQPPRSRRELAEWRPGDHSEPQQWLVASVHQAACDVLLARLAVIRPADTVRVLQPQDFGLAINVKFPERVGPDRLAAAAAANARRDPDRWAVIVDSGTAITVDLVDRQGVFQGGAILPGMGMAARALHEYTDRLPLVEAPQQRPVVVGKSTEEAMSSGLYWGAIGAVRRLIELMAAEAEGRTDVFITPSAAGWVEQLGESVQVVDDLVLEGVALAANVLQRDR